MNQLKKYKSAGNALRRLREGNDMSLRTVASQVELSHSFLSKVEKGHKVPTKDLIERLCNIYGADAESKLALCGDLPDDIRLIVQNNGKDVFKLLRLHFANKRP